MVCLSIIFTLTGCQSEKIEEKMEQIEFVSTQSVQVKNHPQYIQYNGRVVSDEIRKLSFKQGGRIEEIFVEETDVVKVGDLIMTLDDTSVLLNKEQISEDLSLAQTQYEKAKKQYEFYQDKESDIRALYNEGSASKNQLDEIQLQLKIAKDDVSLARSNIEKAKLALDNIDDVLLEHQIRANANGEISDLLVKEGEMVQGGMPVALLNEKSLMISFGIVQDDYNVFKRHDDINVYYNEKVYKGVIEEVSTFPDQATSTYEVRSRLLEGDIPINAIVSITYPKNEIKGAKIPINAVLSDGKEDYVYVEKEAIAYKRVVKIVGIDGSNVIVEGLENGEKLVVEGMKRIKDQQQVQVVR